MRLLTLSLAAAVALSAGAADARSRKAKPAAAASPVETATALRDRALNDPTAFAVVESLTTEVGGRPAGSEAQRRAMEWGVAKLKALGFTNVHVEPFTITAWARGLESAEVVSPYPQTLAILGLGRSVPTPPEGIEAEAVVFSTYAALLAQAPGSLAGKIAVVTQPMARTQDGSGYGAAVRVRGAGASEAARRGAVAFLLRSISTAENRSPHTGAMNYADDAPKIPAAALSPTDAELLDHMAARGQPIRIRLKMASTTTPDAPAWNVVGEARGRDKPDEAIIIGGHLDSWDPGTGAIDDGAGVAIATAAARLINDLPVHPRRTVRVVMWGSEETGGSGQAYADAHKADSASIILAGESDLGTDPIYSVRLPAGALATPAMAPLPAILAPLKIFVDRDPARFGGSDTEEMQQNGVPVVDFNQDASRYFDIHHSPDDTLSAIDPKGLNQNVAAWASFLYLAAEGDVDFRAVAAAAKAAK